MDAVARGEARGVGTEAADRGFPHEAGLDVEDQVEIDISEEPGRRGELVVELSWTPAGVAGEHARARRRPRLEHVPEQLRRRGQIESVADHLEFRRRLVR